MGDSAQFARCPRPSRFWIPSWTELAADFLNRVLVHTVGMKLAHCCAAVLPLLLTSANPSRAQDSSLKGLIGVRVAVTWTGGADADRDALQADVELKLRQAGMRVAIPEQATIPPYPLLFIGVGGTGAAVPVGVELHEPAYLGSSSTP